MRVRDGPGKVEKRYIFLFSRERLRNMGNTKSGALSKAILNDLKMNTKYTEEELCTWYASFLKECPTGRITKEQFEGIYASFFPDADPTAYARHVFRSFDTNADGTLDFKEYIVALHLTSSGKTMRKLEWAFALYDVDGNGTISKNEVEEIVRVGNTKVFLLSILLLWLNIENELDLCHFGQQRMFHSCVWCWLYKAGRCISQYHFTNGKLDGQENSG